MSEEYVVVRVYSKMKIPIDGSTPLPSDICCRDYPIPKVAYEEIVKQTEISTYISLEKQIQASVGIYGWASTVAEFIVYLRRKVENS